MQLKKIDLEFQNLDADIFFKYVGKETDALYKDIDFAGYFKEWASTLQNETFPIKEQLANELELIGSFITTFPEDDAHFLIKTMNLTFFY